LPRSVRCCLMLHYRKKSGKDELAVERSCRETSHNVWSSRIDTALVGPYLVLPAKLMSARDDFPAVSAFHSCLGESIAMGHHLSQFYPKRALLVRVFWAGSKTVRLFRVYLFYSCRVPTLIITHSALTERTECRPCYRIALSFLSIYAIVLWKADGLNRNIS